MTTLVYPLLLRMNTRIQEFAVPLHRSQDSRFKVHIITWIRNDAIKLADYARRTTLQFFRPRLHKPCPKIFEGKGTQGFWKLVSE